MEKNKNDNRVLSTLTNYAIVWCILTKLGEQGGMSGWGFGSGKFVIVVEEIDCRYVQVLFVSELNNCTLSHKYVEIQGLYDNSFALLLPPVSSPAFTLNSAS